jgi:hypothetical protein
MEVSRVMVAGSKEAHVGGPSPGVMRQENVKQMFGVCYAGGSGRPDSGDGAHAAAQQG